MALRTQFNLAIDVRQTAAGDYLGQVVDQFPAFLELWTSGTGAGLADLYYYDNRLLGAGATESHDLTALTPGPLGANVNMTELRLIAIRAAPANGDALDVTPNAVNGFTDILQAAGDLLRIHEGTTFIWACPTDGVTAIAAGNRVIDIINTDGAAGINYEILIVGTSA